MCSCFVPGYHSFNSLTPCLNTEQGDCVNRIYTAVNLDFDAYCPGKCPQECDSTDYSISVSTSTFPTDFYVKKIINETFVSTKYPNISVSELVESLTSVRVFYSELKYEEIKEKAQLTFEDLISSFGGLLSLFLGASFVTLFELLEVILKFMIFIFKESKQRLQKNNGANK